MQTRSMFGASSYFQEIYRFIGWNDLCQLKMISRDYGIHAAHKCYTVATSPMVQSSASTPWHAKGSLPQQKQGTWSLGSSCQIPHFYYPKYPLPLPTQPYPESTIKQYDSYMAEALFDYISHALGGYPRLQDRCPWTAWNESVRYQSCPDMAKWTNFIES